MSFQIEKWASRFPTPFYVYDLDCVASQLVRLRTSFQRPLHIFYAMKANNHPALLKMLAKQNVGVDIVSYGELTQALNAGLKPETIIFSGVAKSRNEIMQAIDLGLRQINVESLPELRRIIETAQTMGRKANIALRLNPDVNPVTHPYITTGLKENKFGLDLRVLPQVDTLLDHHRRHVDLVGLTLHIGSQLFDLSAIEEAVTKIRPIFESYQERGFPMRNFDFGGGIGVPYTPMESENSLEDYAVRIERALDGLDCDLFTEPGRILVGAAGYLVTQVEYVKETPEKKFAICDTGMHHLIRPALYGAYHDIRALKNSKGGTQVYDIVGPICESSDVLGKDRVLPILNEGDLLVIHTAGAYGAVMSSRYNGHAPPFEVAIQNGQVVGQVGGLS